MSDLLTPEQMAATHTAAFTQSRPWSAAEFAALLDSPLVFTAGDKRCFALVRVIADEAELLTIATDPDRRREGLARARMDAWQTRASEMGAQRAFLEVAADNEAAIALYSGMGYQRAGLRRGYYQVPGKSAVDAVIMTRDLTQR